MPAGSNSPVAAVSDPKTNLNNIAWPLIVMKPLRGCSVVSAAGTRSFRLRPSLLRPSEMPQVRRRLVFAHRHQLFIGAQKILFLSDRKMGVGLMAILFDPE